MPCCPIDVHLAKPGLRLCPTTLVLSHLVGRGPPSGPKSVADRRSGTYGNENWEFAVNGLMEKALCLHQRSPDQGPRSNAGGCRFCGKKPRKSLRSGGSSRLIAPTTPRLAGSSQFID